MSSPNEKRSGNRRSTWLWIGAAVLGVSACQSVFGIFDGDDGGPVFPHAVHVDEEGLDCTMCHTGAEDAPVAGFPETTQGCMLCHEELDADKPFEKTVAAFLNADGRPRWLGKDPYAGDVQFHHGKHFEDAELDCIECHKASIGAEGDDLRISGGKTRCMDCHARTQRGNDCSVCHRTLRVDERPADHTTAWTRLHGDHSRRMILGTGETTCAQCHSRDSCTQCHANEMPGSHTNFWRVRGHGLTASIDRTSCFVCHRTDFCQRCHETTQPRSHRGSFGDPQNRHCTTCHFPLPSNGCIVCHKGAPSHLDATGLPADHHPAMNCRLCHGFGAPLPHPDGGHSCIACHR